MAAFNGLKFVASNYHRALFENAKKNSVLLIDQNGIILEANRAFLMSFGYEINDVVGKNFSMLFNEADQKRDLPFREINTVLDEGQSFDNNYLLNKNNSLTWVSGESLLLVNDQNTKYIIKIIQNIHAQKEAESSIIRLNSFNESILSSIEDSVIVIDKDLKILKANRSFAQLFNFSDQDVSNLDFRTFIRSFDINSELYNSIVSTIQAKSCIAKIQLELDLENAEKRTFEISCTKLEENGERSNILLIFHDITGQKHFEQQREDILNFVAHELRNPLTSVTLNIELIEEMLAERKLGEFRGDIDRTKKSVERLKKLINELYKSTKLISGNFDPENSVFDLEQMIDEAIQSVLQGHSNFKIVKKVAASVNLLADREKLIQVLTNYLNNAIKYSMGNTKVEVEAAPDEDSVLFSVRDYGSGIPSEDLPYIFKRFFRSKKTKTMEGLGLGLFLSRQIIEAHKGRTWVESKEGEGSTFYFSIPLTKDLREEALHTTRK